MSTVKEIINNGFSNHQYGNLVDAERAYLEALSMDEENADVCNLLSVLKLQQDKVNSAIDWAEKAINRNSCDYYYETLFQAYIRAGFYEKIIECENYVMKAFPKSFPLLFNLALAYKNLKQNKRAIELYERALKLDPSSYQAWANLGHLYSIENQGKNAVSAYKICKKLKPNDSETDYFLSLALMRTKNYEKGLKLFESRISREAAVALQNRTYPNLAPMGKLWKGENIKNKTIYVYYEAGYGDVIMFARYLPLLKKRCKKIVFYPQKPLVELFNQEHLGVDEIIDGYIPEQNMSFDVHAPIMSLPYLLGLKGNRVFESPEGYLSADPELVKNFKEKHFTTDKIKIGFKWQGNTYYDQDRVIPVEKFAPLIEMENTKFYSFQTFEGAENLEKLTSKYDITDIGNEVLDFKQTAAALMNLDLLICNDTSLAHLAGALGVPCFMIVPYEVNWRWHENHKKCDWYDSVKIFRQKSMGDWDGVFEDVKTHITNCLKNMPSR